MNDTEQQRQQQLALQVASAVQQRYVSLGKNGKPQPHEHTVLAGIVAYYDADHQQQQQQQHAHCLKLPASTAGVAPAMHVIAIGTGTKCLGGSKRSAAGDVINDSHAEAITRRAFVAWTYQQLAAAAETAQLAVQSQPQAQQAQQQAPDQQQQPQQQEPQQEQPAPQQLASDTADAQAGAAPCSSAFYWCPDSCKFKLHPGICFAMYVSQPPCGDASIFSEPGQPVEASAAGEAEAEPSSCTAGCEQAPCAGPSVVQQQQQLQQQTGRTGAKLIRLSGVTDVGQAAAALAAPPCSSSDPVPAATPATAAGQERASPAQQLGAPVVPGASDVESGLQEVGVLRRKPGKGDPTLSLSCSDKLARWACLGLQGCLLSACLAAPLYLSLLVVAAPPCTPATAAVEAAAAGSSGGSADQLAQQRQQQQPASGMTPDAATAAVEAAGRRALSERLAGCASLLPQPFAVRPPAVAAVGPPDAVLGLSSSPVRKSPQGVSINWSCQLPLLRALQQPPSKPSVAAAAGVHEVTLSAVGRKTGPVKNDAVLLKKRSRLATAALYEQWRALLQAVPLLQPGACDAAAAGADGSFSVQQYRRIKEAVGGGYHHAWLALRTSSLFGAWFSKWEQQ